MKYDEILKILKEKGISDLYTDVALCVNRSLTNKVTDEEFNALCKYVYHIFDNIDISYFQLIADIVVDCYLNCEFGYLRAFKEKNSNKKLTMNNLINYELAELIEDLFYIKMN